MSDPVTQAITPLRDLAYEDHLGCRTISATTMDYADGSEDRVLEIINNAQDLGSLSDELDSSAETWPERYHLSRSRANCLRPFALDKSMNVLEVGGGCGAITRYLGETCGLVDMLEPAPARAAAARSRTRDLQNVEIFVADIASIPPTPTYDLVVLVGVLEYVGGSKSDAAQLEFLQQLSRVLKAGGSIICAIENRLGVKYLAGAPEDHSGRPFHGVEGYQTEGPARTFSRLELQDLFGRAGLHTTIHHAFPDYKMARAVFSDAIFETPEGRALTYRVPRFPSPDWELPREPCADEQLLWTSLVESGMGGQFSNSFVIVAGADSVRAVWPEHLLGTFYATMRRTRFATETDILPGPTLQRRLLKGSGREVAEGSLSIRIEDSDYIAGTPLIEAMVEADDSGMRTLLKRWQAEVETREPISIEFVPSNLIIEASGDLAPIDQEWWSDEYDSVDILRRGSLWAGHQLTQMMPPGRWQMLGGRVGDVSLHLGEMVGLDPSSNWLDDAIVREAELQATVHDCERSDAAWRGHVEARRLELQELMDANLDDGPLGSNRGISARLGITEALVSERDGHIERLVAMVSEKDTHIQNLQVITQEKDSHIANLQGANEEKDAALADARGELERVKKLSVARLTDALARLKNKGQK